MGVRQKGEEKEEDHYVKLRLFEIAPRSVMSGYLALRVCIGKGKKGRVGVKMIFFFLIFFLLSF